MSQHPNVTPLHRRGAPGAVPRLASVQGALALDLLQQLDPPREALGGRRRRRPPGAGGLRALPALRDARTSDDDLTTWARCYVQVATEAVAGDRPVGQLLRWTSPGLYLDLSRRAQLTALAAGRLPGERTRTSIGPRVMSVHVCRLDDHTAEISAHVRYGGRSRAIAARFEVRRSRWLCTAMEFA